jgi:tRNA U34 5-methylaminomethyl-2-thiouridine-forming methyltransferase MnmC
MKRICIGIVMNVNESGPENGPGSSEFREFGFEIEKTKDDSPTLRILNGTEFGEWMHHSGGAFSETFLIYGQALKWGFEKNPEPQILSLGLGLGYVEVLAVGISMLHKTFCEIDSFEIVDGLKKEFKKFYTIKRKSEVFEEILQRTAKSLNLPAGELYTQVQKALEENRLRLNGNFTQDSRNAQSFDVLCYDAFSKKTSPELWDENWMTEFFQRGSKQSCISSYASNGSFKRALHKSGYQVEILEGFQGKRNRTWATKSLS